MPHLQKNTATELSSLKTVRSSLMFPECVPHLFPIGRKKKEIGILRAIGARGADVFKIFFCESGVIVGICLILSVIGTLIAATVLNNVLKAQMGLAVTVFVFGSLPILLMIAVAIVVAFLGTFFPVFIAARKKPVDTIRAL